MSAGGRLRSDKVIEQSQLESAIDSIEQNKNLKEQIEIVCMFFNNNNLSENLYNLKATIDAIKSSGSKSALHDILQVINKKLDQMKTDGKLKEFLDSTNSKKLTEILNGIELDPEKDKTLTTLRSEVLNKLKSPDLKETLAATTAASTAQSAQLANPSAAASTAAFKSYTANQPSMDSSAEKGLPWKEIVYQLKTKYKEQVNENTQDSVSIGNTQIKKDTDNVITAKLKNTNPTTTDVDKMCEEFAIAVKCIKPPEPVNLKGGTAEQAVQIFEKLKDYGVECTLDKSLLTKIETLAANPEKTNDKYRNFLETNQEHLKLSGEKQEEEQESVSRFKR